MPPYQILVLKNVRNTGTAKLPAQIFACKRITPQKLHLKWELRRDKSYTSLVQRHAAIARQLNVVKRTCKDTEFCNDALGQKKVKYISERTLELCSKKQYILKRIVLGAGSLQLRTMFFLKASPCYFVLSYNWKHRNFRKIVTHDIILWHNSLCHKTWNQADKTT